MENYIERLNDVNSRINTTNIKGKSYAEVNQRVLAFWELFPNGRIVTKQLADDGSRCEFMAAVYRDKADEQATSTGHAFEVKSGHINSTSYIENCETSAVGRALAFMGIGATVAIASADEVANAIATQEAQPTREKKEPPAQGEFTAKCKNCGKRYTFNSQEQYKGFLTDPKCCPKPDWQVE